MISFAVIILVLQMNRQSLGTWWFAQVAQLRKIRTAVSTSMTQVREGSCPHLADEETEVQVAGRALLQSRDPGMQARAAELSSAVHASSTPRDRAQLWARVWPSVMESQANPAVKYLVTALPHPAVWPGQCPHLSLLWGQQAKYDGDW